MNNGFIIKRTTSADPDFQLMISRLDNELWNELKEDQATYDPYNKVADLNTAIVIYENTTPVASGCFKKYTDDTVEIKRMYVEKNYRGKGISKLVLSALENWAIESGFHFAILETSIHFKTARSLYEHAGYNIIDNYDQYAGLEESVCMKKELNTSLPGSEFKYPDGIEYFNFEEDFVEQNIRCIPMIVRFKMDAAGIKLKLSEWTKFKKDERIELAIKPVETNEEQYIYKTYLTGLIQQYTTNEVTIMAIDQNPPWRDETKIPGMVNEKVKQLHYSLDPEQWKRLTELQRFALLKLCKESHESKNFPKALKEFKLINQD